MPENKTEPITRQEYLKRYLVPFWLRPESALWYGFKDVICVAPAAVIRRATRLTGVGTDR